MSLSLAAVTAAGETDDSADTVFLNGRVLLYPEDAGMMSHAVEWARAVAVKDGVISYVGNNGGAKKQIGPDTEVVDLDGKMLMPGLGDGHLHGGAHSECSLDYEGGTVETILGKIKDCLLSDEQIDHLDSNFRLSVDHLMGEGLQPAGTSLDRHILDRLSADPADDPFGTGTSRPIVVQHMDHHKAYTNTQAIMNAGVDENTPDPVDGFIGRDADGFPNGQFADFRANWGPSLPPEPDADYLEVVADYQDANGVGITSVLHPGFSPDSLPLLQRAADEGHLTVRGNQALSANQVRGVDDPITLAGIIDALDDARTRFDGYRSPASPGEITVDTVKIVCDGVPEFPGQTAAMLNPYRVNVGTPENPVWEPGDWRGEEPSCSDSLAGFSALDAAGWTMHTHSLGDRAVRETLDNFETIQAENEPWDRRHTISHMQFVDQADVSRFGELGVVASMSLQWNQRDGWSVDGLEGHIAPEQLEHLYPVRSVIEGGGVVAHGADWPVTPPWVPWSAIEQAVTREGRENPARVIYPGPLSPAQSITFPQAIKASTIGVAYQMHRDDEVGSIAVGKLADLIVIDRDLSSLFACPVRSITTTRLVTRTSSGSRRPMSRARMCYSRWWVARSCGRIRTTR
jgi:predicted amidohydrolase YtcJ